MAKAEKMTRTGKVTGRSNCTACGGSRVRVSLIYFRKPNGAMAPRIQRQPCPVCGVKAEEKAAI